MTFNMCKPTQAAIVLAHNYRGRLHLPPEQPPEELLLEFPEELELPQQSTVGQQEKVVERQDEDVVEEGEEHRLLTVLGKEPHERPLQEHDREAGKGKNQQDHQHALGGNTPAQGKAVHPALSTARCRSTLGPLLHRRAKMRRSSTGAWKLKVHLLFLIVPKFRFVVGFYYPTHLILGELTILFNRNRPARPVAALFPSIAAPLVHPK